MTKDHTSLMLAITCSSVLTKSGMLVMEPGRGHYLQNTFCFLLPLSMSCLPLKGSLLFYISARKKKKTQWGSLDLASCSLGISWGQKNRRSKLCGNSMTYTISTDLYFSKTIRKNNVGISVLEVLAYTSIWEYFIKYSKPFTNNSFIFLQ